MFDRAWHTASLVAIVFWYGSTWTSLSFSTKCFGAVSAIAMVIMDIFGARVSAKTERLAGLTTAMRLAREGRIDDLLKEIGCE